MSEERDSSKYDNIRKVINETRIKDLLSVLGYNITEIVIYNSEEVSYAFNG